MINKLKTQGENCIFDALLLWAFDLDLQSSFSLGRLVTHVLSKQIMENKKAIVKTLT